MLRIFTLWILLVHSSLVAASDFPTVETVRQVVSCMAELGGQTEENLLTCGCRQDEIEGALTFRVFEQASLQERYNLMPGKRGGLFRDDKISREQLKQLQAIRKQAFAACPAVRKVRRAEESK